MDLQRFLGGHAVVTSKRSRVLVIEHEGFRVGLLVDRVRGLRHFDKEQRAGPPRVDGPLGRFITEAFKPEGQVWPVFSMKALTESPEFQMASL